MKPNKGNFCGGNYQDWVEVMLTSKCNGSCEWCVDKNGFHPKQEVPYHVLTDVLKHLGKKNVILLGGEPSMYKHLEQLVRQLYNNGHSVYITTNGSRMTKLSNIPNFTGVNISIHHYDLSRNSKITGINLGYPQLKANISRLYWYGTAKTRLNCTLIKGQIDSVTEITKYIEFAKKLGVASVRFAELKHDDKFVDLYKLYGTKYGLTSDPFKCGCSTDAIINGMPVSFRQMCGIQTKFRTFPKDPETVGNKKSVLYYDGNVYDGWQTKQIKENKMPKKLTVKQILKRVKSGKMTTERAAQLLARKDSIIVETQIVENRFEGVHCQY